jgi:hypothetical protein
MVFVSAQSKDVPSLVERESKAQLSIGEPNQPILGDVALEI